MPELSRWVRGEWVAVICGLVTIVVVLAYCAWRLSVVNDVIARKEIEFHQILLIQQELRANQIETLKLLRQPK